MVNGGLVGITASVIFVALSTLFLPRPTQGDAASDRAEAAAVHSGKALFHSLDARRKETHGVPSLRTKQDDCRAPEVVPQERQGVSPRHHWSADDQLNAQEQGQRRAARARYR